MIRRLFAPLAIAIVIAALLPSESRGQTPSADVVPNQYIVVLEAGANARAQAAQAARTHGTQTLHVYEYALRGFAFKGSAQAAQALARNPQVRFVAEDRVVQASDQPLPTGVNRIDGELNAVARINGVDERVDVNVAVIDTGIDLDHPDLNVVGGKNCSDRDSYDDGNGHGSHVAGTIGALDNNIGVVGVAPGVRLYAVRVLNNRGSGSWSSVACGVDWVTSTRTDLDTTNDITVANMSLGGSGSDDGNCGNTNGDPLHVAVCGSVAKGVVHVVAAGNENANASGSVPASYSEVLTVSAIADYNGLPGGGASATCGNYGGDDRLASFSNYGDDVDVALPGVCIRSTYKGGGYATMSGTSMASPHAAGIAALYVSSDGQASDAVGVTAIYSALKAAGGGYAVAQSDPKGFTHDKDSDPEPFGYVGTVIESHDVAVTGLTAPAAVTQGNTAAVEVTVTNEGTDEESFSVKLFDGTPETGTQIGTTQPVSLVAGASKKLTFSWETSTETTATGSHVLTATASTVADEDDTDDNSDTATVTVNEPSAGNTMHVADLDGSVSRKGASGRWEVFVTATIRNGDGNPVSNATVSGAWSGATSGSANGTTGSAGTVTFSTGTLSAGTAVTFIVNNVTHTTLSYSSDDNTDGTSITVTKQ